MKSFLLMLATAGLLSVSGASLAANKSESGSRANDTIWLGHGRGFSNWRPVARDELIIWSSRSRPYLVKIWKPYTSLKFVHTIGFSTFGGRITHFDNIYVDGQRLPIKSIVALDREVAEQMRWRKEE